MFPRSTFVFAAMLMLTPLMVAPGAALAQDAKPNDAQIAHIAYTAGVLDMAAGKQAIAKTSDPQGQILC